MVVYGGILTQGLDLRELGVNPCSQAGGVGGTVDICSCQKQHIGDSPSKCYYFIFLVLYREGMSTPDALEEGYKIALWKDDPWSPEGRERYNSALRKFKKLIEHPWLKNILSKEKVSLLDLGAGKGIGGVALAKTLKQHGIEVDLTMVDLRKIAIQDSLLFAHKEGVKAEAFQMNAIEAHKLGKFDIVLMYGAILTHFDSWNMPRLFASSAKSLKEDGIIVIEEFDRVHRIFTKSR